MPYIILNELFISGEFGFQRQTSLQVSWHRFQDCPIYGEFDWHHPQRTAMTSLAAIAGLMMASGIYSGLVTWLVGLPWNFNLEGSRGECAQSISGAPNVHHYAASSCTFAEIHAIHHIPSLSITPSISIFISREIPSREPYLIWGPMPRRLRFPFRRTDVQWDWAQWRLKKPSGVIGVVIAFG